MFDDRKAGVGRSEERVLRVVRRRRRRKTSYETKHTKSGCLVSFDFFLFFPAS